MRVFVLLPLLLTGSLLLASDNVVKQKANGNRLLTLFEPQDGETRAIPFTSTGTVEPGRTVQGFVIDPVNNPNTLLPGQMMTTGADGKWTISFSDSSFVGAGRIVRVETVDGSPDEFGQAVIHIMPAAIKPGAVVGLKPEPAAIKPKSNGLRITDTKQNVKTKATTVQVSGTMQAGVHPMVHGLLLDKSNKKVLVGTTLQHGTSWVIAFPSVPAGTYTARVRSLRGKHYVEQPVVVK